MAIIAKKARPWQIPAGGKGSFAADGYWLGAGGTPLEVAVATTTGRPTESDVRNLWKRRKGNQPSPLLLVVLWGDRATVCGTTGDEPAVYSDRDPDQIARVADMALREPDHHAAVRLLSAYLPEESGGIRNVGLFATHHLIERVPNRADWPTLCKTGASLLNLRREKLVEALGFQVEPKGQAAVLRVHGNARVLAMFLDDTENPDASASRFEGMSPVSWAIATAAADNIPYVVVARGPQLRVYLTRAGAGAAGRGGTSAFLELNLPLLIDANAGYLPLLFSAESLADGGAFEGLLSESHDFAADLGVRLRSRVYEYAVPSIAQALIDRHAEAGGDTGDAALAGLYERSLLVLFRLLFVSYAEDKGLLPLTTNGLYRQRSLKHVARDLSALANEHGWEAVPFDENSTDLWDNVRSLWSAIDKGRKEWNVPPYNGGMFSVDPDVSTEGAALASITLTDVEFGPALLGLLVDEGDSDIFGPVDFATLDVREFGTIYEGLLESDLSLAGVDLTIGNDDTYLPAGPKDEVWVEEGAVYLHNKSGARKASGSYFTKPFAVNHLLDHALEPALDNHIERLTTLLDEKNEAGAAEAFFDFRCVDLSMGSGHFLVAAVDRIERRLSEFLTQRRVPGVIEELARLSDAAEANLAAAGVSSEGTDTNTLLRRQIARRCIYGVDLNATSVELARLALWIHTFVKGLPLTSLNHGLVVGNSLTGIGTLDEAIEVLDPDKKPGATSFVRLAVLQALEEARSALMRFAATSEASAAEVKQARKAHVEATAAVEPARLLFDLAVAARIGEATIPLVFDAHALVAAARKSHADVVAAGLGATHFPVVFPEVFLRDRPGFDCILGNPPWQEATLEEPAFWGRHAPGLRSKSAAVQKKDILRFKKERPDLLAEYEKELAHEEAVRAALLAGPFPGMGTGDPDLYKAFTWRFWSLIREEGQIGVVLPRQALAAAGSGPWRKRILVEGRLDLTMLLNTARWAFDMEPRYTIGLVAIRKGVGHGGRVTLRGPFSNAARYEAGMNSAAAVVDAADLASWSEHASVPLLPSAEALDVFLKLRCHPRFDVESTDWSARPVAELHATNEKGEMILDADADGDLWPVYKGESFDLWAPDTGTYYAMAEPDHIVEYLYEKRLRQQRHSKSAFSAFSAEWAEDRDTLPCLHPRVALRDITRATDTRTVRCALVPANVVITNKGPYLLWSAGDASDVAYVLGMLSSIPLDWYARRFVELGLNFHTFNAFPVPRPTAASQLRNVVVQNAGRLAATDERFSAWADLVGVPVGSVGAEDRDRLIVEIDAAVALLYGLSAADVRIVFETFHDGWDYKPRLEAVLAVMSSLEGTV